VADSADNKIRKIVIATGVVTTLAGTGASGAADGAGTVATFNGPSDITTDGSNLYVADTGNNKIRKVVIATGVVSSLTGAADTTVAAGAADGAGSTATFNYPSGITTDGSNLYVADTYNNKIRKVVIATGVVSSITGATDTTVATGTAGGFARASTSTTGAGGAADGLAGAATFYYPQGITTDGSNLYVADTGNNKIRKIVIATGVVSSVTGAADTTVDAGAADGAGTAAAFNNPSSITSDGSNLYVADTGNNKIRKVAIATDVVSSLTGAADATVAAGAADGAGSTATFNYPSGITTDGSNLYVVDMYNQAIRKIH
jgi:sugar lactone lactonase YvrE